MTFGFVNECYKTGPFQGVQRLPFYLIKLIANWVCFEELHLLIKHDQDDPKAFHWMINVDNIIESTLTNWQ